MSCPADISPAFSECCCLCEWESWECLEFSRNVPALTVETVLLLNNHFAEQFVQELYLMERNNKWELTSYNNSLWDGKNDR